MLVDLFFKNEKNEKNIFEIRDYAACDGFAFN